MANTAKKADKNNGNSSKMFKTKRVLSESWAELSPAKSTKRTMTTKTKKTEGEGGEGVGVQVRRGKNPCQGESPDKDKEQDRQHNYKQTRSTRHAGRPVDYHVLSGHQGGKVFPLLGDDHGPNNGDSRKRAHTHTHTLSKVNVARAG